MTAHDHCMQKLRALLKMSLFLYFLREEVIWVWFDIGMNKWWQNLNLFWQTFTLTEWSCKKIHFTEIQCCEKHFSFFLFFFPTLVIFILCVLLWTILFLWKSWQMSNWQLLQMCWWDVWSWLSHVKWHRNLIKESSSNDF